MDQTARTMAALKALMEEEETAKKPQNSMQGQQRRTYHEQAQLSLKTQKVKHQQQ